ncbi:hypothetical protein FRX31_010439 [Thalictrum thalictroides]|uniref:RNase H type-1 domain-containing protein n=1 Tax=Thalictrum thalictroides TaxID=46969 RepID=A0A7J6WRH4_THATH|nr:hypothetical protein FRX31_010439 [Thalictrum thalictroides]
MARIGSTCAGSALTAECSGVLAAIQWCLEHGFRQVEVETDNARVADYLRRLPTNVSWTSETILDNVLDLLYNFVSVIFKHCNRNGNWAAHLLA